MFKQITSKTNIPIAKANLITSTKLSLMPLRYVKIQEKLYQKSLREITLNKDVSKIYYVNNKGLINFYLYKESTKVVTITAKENFTTWEPIYNNVSGMMHNINSFHNTNYIIRMIMKFNFCMFAGKSLKNIEDISQRVNCFLQQDKILSSEVYYSLAQHMLVNILPYIKFSVKNLEQLTNNQISYASYDKTPIKAITLVESIVFKYTMGSFLAANENKIKIIAQNTENLMSNSEAFKILSEKQLKQSYGDFIGLIPKNLSGGFLLDTINNKVIFYDVKLYNMFLEQFPLLKGYLSLSTLLTPEAQLKLDIRFLGDIKTSIKQKNYSIMSKIILKEAFEEGTKIVNNNVMPLAEKLTRMAFLRNNLDLNPGLTDFVCSRISNTPFNTETDNFFNDLAPQIEQHIHREHYTLNLEKLFPEKQNANVGEWQHVLLDIIDFFPEDIKQNMLENYHKFKLLEHDCL